MSCEQPGLFPVASHNRVTSDVARRMSGASFRQLDYWARTGMLGERDPGSGNHRSYTFNEVVALRAVHQLLAAGISLTQARVVAQSIIEQPPASLGETTLVADGATVVVCHSDADVAWALRHSVGVVAIALRETVKVLVGLGLGPSITPAPRASHLRAVS